MTQAHLQKYMMRHKVLFSVLGLLITFPLLYFGYFNALCGNGQGLINFCYTTGPITLQPYTAWWYVGIITFTVLMVVGVIVLILKRKQLKFKPRSGPWVIR